jgi:hypothetical protein
MARPYRLPLRVLFSSGPLIRGPRTQGGQRVVDSAPAGHGCAAICLMPSRLAGMHPPPGIAGLARAGGLVCSP